jgi:hypothetical protein
MVTRACPEHAGREFAGTAEEEECAGLRLAPKYVPHFRPSSHNPDGDSIEPRAKEVKKESLMERIKPIEVSDFRSKYDRGTA